MLACRCGRLGVLSPFFEVVNKKCFRFKENPQVYNEVCEKGGLFECTFLGLVISLGFGKKVELQRLAES